jgi:hypothetical protein
MLRIVVICAAVAMILVGCACPPQTSTMSMPQAANPDAIESPVPARSNVLAPEIPTTSKAVP